MIWNRWRLPRTLLRRLRPWTGARLLQAPSQTFYVSIHSEDTIVDVKITHNQKQSSFFIVHSAKTLDPNSFNIYFHKCHWSSLNLYCYVNFISPWSLFSVTQIRVQFVLNTLNISSKLNDRLIVLLNDMWSNSSTKYVN